MQTLPVPVVISGWYKYNPYFTENKNLCSILFRCLKSVFTWAQDINWTETECPKVFQFEVFTSKNSSQKVWIFLIWNAEFACGEGRGPVATCFTVALISVCLAKLWRPVGHVSGIRCLNSLLTARLLAGQSVPPCSASFPVAEQNQHHISHYHVEGVAWPACNSWMCGGPTGSWNHCRLKITKFLLLHCLFLTHTSSSVWFTVWLHEQLF